jgi:hypothetical protein
MGAGNSDAEMHTMHDAFMESLGDAEDNVEKGLLNVESRGLPAASDGEAQPRLRPRAPRAVDDL